MYYYYNYNNSYNHQKNILIVYSKYISYFFIHCKYFFTGGGKRKFKSLARIASGLSDKELLEIDQKLGRHWKNDGHENAKNYGIIWGKDVPNVWIKPEESCVLTVTLHP